MVDGWESLLAQVESANSVNEILEIVSEFDKSINEMREKRSPISILKFEYETMKNKAEIQADHKNLFTINNALKILDTAKKMADGNPTVSRIDRIEVLLTWASEIAPEIKQDLNSYSKDAFKVRASDILQRAKSVENLADLSLRKNKFLPGYIDYIDSMKERINVARDHVMKNDLDSADNMVRDLFSEWRQVSNAYADDPFGSDVGYDADELKRIEYRKQLDYLSKTVSNFYNADFAQYADEYVKMTDDASELIDYGNFIDAESKLSEIRQHLSEYLPLNNANIFYDIRYDQEKDIWIIDGAVNKPDGLRKKDRRQNLHLTINDGAGEIHSKLKFAGNSDGEFFTQWQAPTKPGLYVVTLQFMNYHASQIVNIEEKIERSYSDIELDSVDLAREFEELEEFIEKFGGEKYKGNSKFESIINEIKIGLADRDSETVKKNLQELRKFIERHLPIRSKYAVIKAEYSDDKLIISGQVYKQLSFREDLFVDIFDQKGNHIEEIAFDDQGGRFNEVLSIPLTRGTYVAQLEFHDLIVTDFFTVL